MTSNLVLAGIDYSMSSPAMCVHTGDSWSIQNCQFVYTCKTKSKIFHESPFNGVVYPTYDIPINRFSQLSLIMIRFLEPLRPDMVALEGYSYGSSGKVFEIGENMGLLKFRLAACAIPFVSYSPPHVKKYATGKGNAKKELMYSAFVDDVGEKVLEKFNPNHAKIKSPVSDIVDSYFICKKLFHEQTL